MSTGVQKREQMVTLDLPVPLCAECERRECKIKNVALVPFTIAGFIFFVLGFIPAWLFAPEGNTPQMLGIDMAVGALAVIITGVM